MGELFNKVTIALPLIKTKKRINAGSGGRWAFGFLKSVADNLGASVVSRIHKMDKDPGIVIVWGTGRGGKENAAFCIKNGIPFIHLDRPYVRRADHLRATYNPVGVSKMRTTIRKVYTVPGDRWRDLNITIYPWKPEASGPVILCCPGEVTAKLFSPAADNFKIRSAELLRANTKRKVVVKPKPKKLSWGLQTEQFIKYLDEHDPYAVVSFNSNTAVEAALYGVPVFVSKYSAAAPVGCLDFTQIDRPVRPERLPWANSLAYAQFSFEEVADPSGAWLDTVLKTQGES